MAKKGPTIESTIKRVYDEYHLGDFAYGASGSDNLNPQREMVKDQLDLMEAAIQELTDEIVKKKLREPALKEEKIRAALNGGAPIASTPQRRMTAKRAGAPAGDTAIFPLPRQLEQLVGTFPGNVNELQMPPVIECNEILKQYGFNPGSSEDGIDELDGELTYIINTGGGSNGRSQGSGSGGSDSDDLSAEDALIGGIDLELDLELNECSRIELLWLKIILIIIKIIKILKLIVDIVITIIMLLIQIICLAAGAWINPPNIAQIVQILISLIMVIISIIISLLLRLLFSLINFDCLGDQTLDLIRQIREAISGFSNTIGLIDPSVISLFGDLLTGGVKDLKDVIKEIMNSKKEAYEKSREEIKKTFSKENLKRIQKEIIDQAAAQAASSFSAEADVKLGQVKEIYTQAKGASDDAIAASQKVQNKWSDLQKAVKTARETIKGASKGTNNGILNSILSDWSIRDLEVD